MAYDCKNINAQSVGAILDGMKHNALQAVRQTMQENRLQSVPIDVDVGMGWTDKDGRTHCGTVTGLSFDGEQLKVQLATAPCLSYWMNSNSRAVATFG